MSSYFSNQSLWKKKNMKERKNKNNHYTNHVKNKKKFLLFSIDLLEDLL